MSDLTLKPLTDYTAIAALYADPYIARVGHDHRAAAPVVHPSASYLGAYVDDVLVGAFLVIESGYIELDIHALLTKQALPHSRRLGRLCLALSFARSDIQRVTAYVMDELKAAANYCRRLGFKDEGMRRNAYMRDGVLHGVHTLGMTRNDWEVLR